ncbi:MAG: FAD-dependent oxidoreductase [Glaciimonas sp.]|nr:FAD-dependent oxidoreductase [Glaciimonas sp.]
MIDQELLKPARRKIVIIGGGVIGMSTAYFVAESGHQVALIEQRSNVAEVATLGNSGMLATASTTLWAVNGMRKRIFKGLFSQESLDYFKCSFKSFPIALAAALECNTGTTTLSITC